MTGIPSIKIKIGFAWWLKPYLTLSRLGYWLGLPLNSAVIAKDFVRSIKLKVM